MYKGIKNNKKGFTLVEVLVYILITSILLIIIGSIVVNVINLRKHLNASNMVHSDARFIINFLSNNIHNVDLIDDVSPAIEQYHFYQLPNYRFSIATEGDNLVYRKTEDTGSGFPDQFTAEAVILNSQEVRVTDLIIQAYDDNEGNENMGVGISFNLTIGNINNSYGYVRQYFSTFLSLR